MCNANYQSGTIIYSSSDLITRNHEVKAGDLVIFKNSYLSIIDSIGESNFTISNGFNFKGEQGIQGIQGETGPQGISVTNVQINSSNHLIITLSNSQTIDAGEIEKGTKLYNYTIIFSSASELYFKSPVLINATTFSWSDLVTLFEDSSLLGATFFYETENETGLVTGITVNMLAYYSAANAEISGLSLGDVGTIEDIEITPL